MDLSKIPVGVNPPYDVNAIIEIPQGGEPVKYEYVGPSPAGSRRMPTRWTTVAAGGMALP